MTKVPGRFLGYAFCVGDLLLELDLDFKIRSADGAIKTTLGAVKADGSTDFLSLLSDRGKGIIESAAKMLTGANRLGPFTVSVGNDGRQKEEFAVFLAKLPTAHDRIYAVLSKPYRLGVTKDKNAPSKVEDKKKQFFERLEGLFEGNPDAAENMLVTVLEAGGNQEISPEKQKVIEDYLKSFSVGGAHATMLADDKFAVVHDKTDERAQKTDFAAQLKKATGVSLTSATIDAAEANLSEEDSLKALVFSLQSFASGGDGGMDIESIQKNCATLIGETTERVKAFRQVLEEGAFSLVFQPIVHLKKGTVHHFEALTRFELPPMIKTQWEMIRFAEDVGLIDDFDYAVTTRAIRKIRELLKKGGAPGIAVNLSGRSLSSPEFMLELISLLRGNKDLKQYLSLEITESSKIHDLDALAQALGEIREIGFKVYLDDFGAGAAGFQYLKKLKVDALKIDGDYIRDAITNKEDRAYLRSMVGLCRDLGITTVGEWVETQEHAKLLTEMGVDYGQGYFFGKPSDNFLVEPAKAS
ncbi:MAG: EAL domain-containing protein [Alphaproteobacteria bacterium]|nr:EAL domain-containing protein [Alphaproteobacteria bacterium]